MVAIHQDGQHQSGVIGPRSLPKCVMSQFDLAETWRLKTLAEQKDCSFLL